MLAAFAAKYGIEYPLLADEDSSVIKAFGILNRQIPSEHEWYGVPYPGTYLVDGDGRVTDKSFFADHQVRESVDDLLQGLGVGRGPEGEIRRTPYLAARAFFAGPTIRRQQLLLLNVEIELAPGLHVYGRPLPAGYVPLEVEVDGGTALEVVETVYPAAQTVRFEALQESLPAYAGRLRIGVRCKGVGEDRDEALQVGVRLRYQACDARVCHPPETVEWALPLRFLPHDWQRLD